MNTSKPEQERMFLLVNKVAIHMVIQAGKKGLGAMEVKGGGRDLPEPWAPFLHWQL